MIVAISVVKQPSKDCSAHVTELLEQFVVVREITGSTVTGKFQDLLSLFSSIEVEVPIVTDRDFLASGDISHCKV